MNEWKIFSLLDGNFSMKLFSSAFTIPCGEINFLTSSIPLHKQLYKCFILFFASNETFAAEKNEHKFQDSLLESLEFFPVFLQNNEIFKED